MMSKSTAVISNKKPEEHTICWSWLLNASSAHFSKGSDIFKTLLAIHLKSRVRASSEDVVRKILEYLPLSDRGNLLSLTQHKRFSVFEKNLHDRLKVKQYTDVFTRFVTFDNQTKAGQMLTHYPQLAGKFISQAQEMDGNAARQFKQPMSAYEYAWCFGNTSMCELLEEHMTEDIKRKVRLQCEARAGEKFMYLVTREGEDNQSKAEAMLKKYPSTLISLKIDTRDLVRHFIKPMSAYEYAYWSGDTRMRTMLNEYVFKDEALRAMVSEQCNDIAKHGVTFEELSNDGKPIPNSTTSGSKHFDYQPLQKAYDSFNVETSQLIASGKDSEEDWLKADALWLKIGVEWAKVPVAGMQEICCPRQPYVPVANTLEDPNMQRTVRCYKWNKDPYCYSCEYLVVRGIVDFRLGNLLSIYKGMSDIPELMPGAREMCDFEAVAALYRARTGIDLEQTLVALKPPESISNLSL